MKVEFVSKSIVLTAKEMKLASQPGTGMYQQLIHVMRDLPDFKVMVKRPCINHNANRGLTYARMEQYIAQHAPDKMETFLSVRSSFSYSVASKWFREEFPECSKAEHLCTTPNEAA